MRSVECQHCARQADLFALEPGTVFLKRPDAHSYVVLARCTACGRIPDPGMPFYGKERFSSEALAAMPWDPSAVPDKDCGWCGPQGVRRAQPPPVPARGVRRRVRPRTADRPVRRMPRRVAREPQPHRVQARDAPAAATGRARDIQRGGPSVRRIGARPQSAACRHRNATAARPRCRRRCRIVSTAPARRRRATNHDHHHQRHARRRVCGAGIREGKGDMTTDNLEHCLQIVCECGYRDHALAFTYDAEDRKLLLTARLTQVDPWWRRLATAWRYFWGGESCGFGDWAEVWLTDHDASQVVHFITKHQEITEAARLIASHVEQRKSAAS